LSSARLFALTLSLLFAGCAVQPVNQPLRASPTFQKLVRELSAAAGASQ